MEDKLNFPERISVEAAGGFEPPNKGFAVQGQRVTNSYQILTTQQINPGFDRSAPTKSYQILPNQNGEKVEDPIQ